MFADHLQQSATLSSRVRLTPHEAIPMMKFLFDHRVTPGAEQPLAVPLFDICSLGQVNLFVGGASRAHNDWGNISTNR
jgi:hypothetical protein